MRGLLDFIKTPEGQGLLGAVAGGMAGARRGAPWNTAGRGLLGGVAAFGNALDREQQAQQFAAQEQDRQQGRTLREMQIAQAKTQMEREQAQQAWRQGLPGVVKQATEATYGAGDEGPTMTPADPSALTRYAMDPRSPYADKILESQLFPKQEAFTLGEGQIRYGSDGKVIAQGPSKAQEKTSVEKLLDAAGITDPAMRQRFTLQALTKQTTHAPAPSAIVNMKQETEEAKKVGGFFGEEYGNALKAGTSAQSKLNRYTRLGELLDNVNTGKFTGAGLEVAKAARTLGFNVGENIGNLEAAQALSGEIALELRNPSGGAGMPGAMSDADRQFLQNMVPGLETTPQGRAFMLDTAKRLAQRDIKVAQMARDYRKRNGSLDEGFYDELARYSEANPLFTGLNTPQPSQSGNAGWSARRK